MWHVANPAWLRHCAKVVLAGQHGLLRRRLLDRGATFVRHLEQVDDSLYRVIQPRPARITPSGVIAVDRCFLDIDYGPFAVLHPSNLTGRKTLHVDRAVVLWSHYWMGYYHWLIDVAPKIVAARAYFGSEFPDLKLVWPIQNTSYEREVLDLLGIPSTAVIDTRRFKAIEASEIYVMPVPGHGIVDQRVLGLRRLLGLGPALGDRRLFVSRAGRRRIANERDLWNRLEQLGFEFIEDRQRPVAEQMALFASAKCIVAPHGAALANIIACGSGATVVELASKCYHPDHYVSLARVLGINFERRSFGTGAAHWLNASRDFTVDVDVVDQCARRLTA